MNLFIECGFIEQVVEIHPAFGIIKPGGSVVLKVGKIL